MRNQKPKPIYAREGKHNLKEIKMRIQGNDDAGLTAVLEEEPQPKREISCKCLESGSNCFNAGRRSLIHVGDEVYLRGTSITVRIVEVQPNIRNHSNPFLYRWESTKRTSGSYDFINPRNGKSFIY